MKLRDHAIIRWRNVISEMTSPSWRPSGHYYSPIPDSDNIQTAIGISKDVSTLPDVDIAAHQQDALLQLLEPGIADFLAQEPSTERRYQSDNTMFGAADAALYYAILTHFKPKRVIEIGSGHTSALALDCIDEKQLATSTTFIEPYADRLRSVLRPSDKEHSTVIECGVQDVADDEFKTLKAGDVLFIDSTHVSKAGSDVNHLFFKVLPTLPAGVLVHVHDVYWPFEYPAEWLREGRAWNEAYVLRAWLSYNTKCKITLFNNWAWQTGRLTDLQSRLPSSTQPPAGIWLELI